MVFTLRLGKSSLMIKASAVLGLVFFCERSYQRNVFKEVLIWGTVRSLSVYNDSVYYSVYNNVASLFVTRHTSSVHYRQSSFSHLNLYTQLARSRLKAFSPVENIVDNFLGRKNGVTSTLGAALEQSRIVVHKFENESKEVFLQLKQFTNCVVKTNADLKFLKFYLDNHLVPKFVNFELYNVSATNHPVTKEFKTGLLLRDISRKESFLFETTKAAGMEIVKLWNATKLLRFFAS